MTHDPMLDGITRWISRMKESDQMMPSPTGPFVLFSDLPALLAAAREDEQLTAVYATESALERADSAYEQGQRDEREACIAVVTAHIRADLTEQAMFCGRKSDLIAAIRAREEKP